MQKKNELLRKLPQNRIHPVPKQSIPMRLHDASGVRHRAHPHGKAMALLCRRPVATAARLCVVVAPLNLCQPQSAELRDGLIGVKPHLCLDLWSVFSVEG